ncbi:hypothetical protein Ccrd_018080 [Cynara cardunculus var. scolymus]|uniref:Uncharacterized protein n=1 Tax=Cynara cardunculus var. scolymus TaxID=59895 RepID=A0A103Y6X0_CYNCS|nr:hypothetical protein Ccrd_018080 [Cynara cardunculus var. scolymus]
MEGAYNGGVAVAEEGCATPKHERYRIPSLPLICPPPPKKKRWSAGGERQPPKNGYFRSPEIEIFFARGH